MTVDMMTSRERVLTALSHREPDCVPIDCGGMRSSGVTAVAYGRLKDHLGMREAVSMFLMFANSSPSSKSRSLRFGGDVLPLDPDQLGDWQPYRLPDGRMACAPASCQFEGAADGSLYWLDGGHRIAKRPEGGLYFDYIDFPLESATSVADLEVFDWGGFSATQIEACV